MTFKIAVASLAFLAVSGAAHAQMEPNTTPTGAAVPSAQQVTGRAADAHGRDHPQTSGNANSSDATQSNEQSEAAPAPGLNTGVKN